MRRQQILRSLVKWTSVFFAAVLSFLPAQAVDFSLAVYGGWSRAGGGDLNKSIAGWRQYYADLESSSFSSTYDLGEAHNVSEIGAAIMMDLSRRWRVGLGVGRLTLRTKGDISTALNLTRDAPPSDLGPGTIHLEETISREVSYEVASIPVTLTAYYHLPLRQKLELFAGAGVGLYFNRFNNIDQYAYNYDYTEERQVDGSTVQYLDTYLTDGEYEETARSTAFGLHAGAGLDFKINSAFSIIVEVFGRWVGSPDFSGEKSDDYDWSHVYGPSGAFSESGFEEELSEGKLWRVDARSSETGNSYPRLIFSDGEPASSDYSGIRPAKINLSGFGVRIGFRIGIGQRETVTLK